MKLITRLILINITASLATIISCKKKEFEKEKQVVSVVNDSIVWKQEYEFNFREENYSDIVQLEDGSFIYYGDKKQEGSYDRDLFIQKLSSKGELIKEINIEDEYSNLAGTVAKTSDGGFITVGTVEYRNNEDRSLYKKCNVIKFSATCEIEWNKQYGNGQSDESGHLVIQDEDDGYVILAETNAEFSDTIHTMGDITNPGYIVDSDDTWIVKLDQFGNKLWDTFITPSKENIEWSQPQKILKAFDGSYVLSAYYQVGPIGNNVKYMWVSNISKKGDILWEQHFKSGSMGHAIDMICTDDAIYAAIEITLDGTNVVSKLGYEGSLLGEVRLNAEFVSLSNSLTTDGKSFYLWGEAMGYESHYQEPNSLNYVQFNFLGDKPEYGVLKNIGPDSGTGSLEFSWGGGRVMSVMSGNHICMFPSMSHFSISEFYLDDNDLSSSPF